MCKKQQMAWSRRGAQYLLHVNTAVINANYIGTPAMAQGNAVWLPDPQLLSSLI